jgi:serine phosphatase RsbU (regulator of sigma subunit)
VNDAPNPLARRLWRCTLINFLGILLAALFTTLHLDAGLLPPLLAEALISLSLVVAWFAAVRFSLSDTWGRWVWLVWLGGAVLALLLNGPVGLAVGLPLAGFFLVFRQYTPYRKISDRRRAGAFGLGVLSFGLLWFAWRYWDIAAAQNGGLENLRYFGAWSLWSLIGFWFASIFHLAIRMRLHFLRLRPKLAVSAVLIGFVPLVLVVVLGVMIFYFGLGGTRAQRAGNILDGWQAMAAAGADLSAAPFDTTFSWSLAGDEAIREIEGVTNIPAPPWVDRLGELVSGVQRVNAAVAGLDEGEDSTTNSDSVGEPTSWYLMDGDIWLIHWQGLNTQDMRARGYLLGQAPLAHLSDVLKAGLDFSSLGPGRGNQDEGEDEQGAAELEQGFAGRKVTYRDVSDDPDYWASLRYFGGTPFKVTAQSGDGLYQRRVFINLRVRWHDLRTEFLESENRENINLAVVISLGVVAGLFLILEVFALFFGIRISEGIVTAVHKLDRGTKELTAGNLDTVIDLPNQDELGDLADSFNIMTAAVRKGREDALANERLTRELETAREIQERLLPSDEPDLADFEITGASIPTRQIGGDYFDFIIQDDGVVGVAIGDVSGKGMPAALLMSNLQASLHGQVIHPSPVSGVVGRVNDLIVGSTDPHMFATFFYGRLDTRSAVFTSTNAGHNPPLVLRADGEFEELKSGGLLLGMVGGVAYKEESTELAPGEIVVMFTDGITEAVGPSAEEDDPEAMFGEEALKEVILRNRHLPAVGIKEAILDAVSQHTSGVAQSDDITLVVIRRQG